MGYLLTRPSPELTPPQRQLELNRCYWGINRIRWEPEVVPRKDCSRVCNGLPSSLQSAIGNLADLILGLLNTTKIRR